MIFFLGVLALVVLVHVLFPNRPVPSCPPPLGYYERPLEEILAERQTEAAIARCLATAGGGRERQRPLALDYDIGTDRYYLRWPDGREAWVSRVSLDAQRITPRFRS